MRRKLLPIVLPIVVLALGVWGCVGALPTLECNPLASERADEAGVDRFGSLWLWNEDTSTVRWLDPEGEVLEVIEIPASRSLDADREWGVVSLDTHGSTLRVVRPGEGARGGREVEEGVREGVGEDTGEELQYLTLSDEGFGVAWIDRDRVAVAPTRADHLVEIWDLARQRLERRIGEGHRIEAGPGATFLRALELGYYPQRQKLYALDSLRGALWAFSLSVEPVSASEAREASEASEAVSLGRIENPRLPELERWRSRIDRQARETGDIQTPLVRVLDLAVDDRGNARIVERCSAARGRVTQVLVTPLGELLRRDLALSSSACSLSFTFWQGELLFLSNAGGEVRQPLLCQHPREGESR